MRSGQTQRRLVPEHMVTKDLFIQNCFVMIEQISSI